MGAVRPLNRRKIVKKITKTADRFQSDRFDRVSTSHRRVRGIDCSTRRRFRGKQKEMKIGNKQERATRHYLPNGFKKFLITNEADLDMLLMNNRTYCGEIANAIGAAKRLRIVQKAREMNVRLTNGVAKARKETTE